MSSKWVTYEKALEILGGSEDFNLPGILLQSTEQAHALAAAKRALKCRIAKPALYDKKDDCYACPCCKEYLERDEYEFNTGYCKVCGQKIEFKR